MNKAELMRQLSNENTAKDVDFQKYYECAMEKLLSIASEGKTRAHWVTVLRACSKYKMDDEYPFRLEDGLTNEGFMFKKLVVDMDRDWVTSTYITW